MEFESSLSKIEASNLLRELADILASDSSKDLVISGETINLSSDIEIEIEYESEDGQSELEIEFKWSNSPDTAKGKFTLFTGKDGHWYFNLKAPNGKIILASKGHKSKQEAKSCISSIKNSVQSGIFVERISSGGQPYFVIKAANNRIIGISQMYKRKISRDKGIASVKKHANTAEIFEV
jgi:hypothetical protein